MDLVKSLNLDTIRDKRYYFLTVLLFEAIRGVALTYISALIVMNFMLMAMIPDDLIWSITSPHCFMSLIETVLC